MRIFEKISSFFDTEEEKAILAECKADEPQLKRDFTVDVAVRNRMKAMRFWLWASLLTDGARCLFAAGAIQKDAGNVPRSTWIFISLYGVMFVLTAVCLIVGLAIRPRAARHYRFISAVCDGYMLLYMLCSAAFTVLDLENGIVGFSLIVALFIGSSTLYYRPAVIVFNVAATMAAFFITVYSMDLQVFLQPLVLFRILTVAVLSVIIGIARYRSKYKVFLKEYTVVQKSEQLNYLNARLQEKRLRIEAQNQQLEFLNNTDELTGLRNRRCFVHESAEMLAEAAETGRFVTLAIIDIDNFKTVNDIYGHTVGDACLRAVGGVLHAAETEKVYAYRIGGDELTVLFRDQSRSDAFLVMNRVSKAVSNLQIPNCKQTITLSVGIYSEIPTAESHIDTYIEKADILLYAAKANGRNQIMTTNQGKGDANDVAD